MQYMFLHYYDNHYIIKIILSYWFNTDSCLITDTFLMGGLQNVAKGQEEPFTLHIKTFLSIRLLLLLF